MQLNQAYALRIRQLLNEKNFSVYKLSQKSALPYSTVCFLLSCKTQYARNDTILNICRGFNISLKEFYSSDLFLPENLDDNN